MLTTPNAKSFSIRIINHSVRPRANGTVNSVNFEPLSRYRHNVRITSGREDLPLRIVISIVNVLEIQRNSCGLHYTRAASSSAQGTVSTIQKNRYHQGGRSEAGACVGRAVKWRYDGAAADSRPEIAFDYRDQEDKKSRKCSPLHGHYAACGCTGEPRGAAYTSDTGHVI
ncbi:hypothetical protein EVAR_19727_1 [Eumeta japonica]|uniref:Uncharacterized protein n=1 Tax=Eumeta variegata TaxID=151549 RepID=A0A4C1URT5_EUMVA|nr:hypothetical protein EVAR_19727_1 [Eumeta japonica]